MRTPKQPSKNGAKYKYYAGFSNAFVSDVLDRYASSCSRVLDPWNGSGTTTAACANRGIQSVGMDINPATLPVAWARLARPDLRGLLCDHLVRARPADLFAANVEAAKNDLLAVYFAERPASLLRSLRNYLALTSTEVTRGLNTHEVRAISGAAFVVFAEVIREALRPMRGTNPSWFSRPKAGQRKISINENELCQMLRDAAAAMHVVPVDGYDQRLPQYEWPKLLLGDSRQDFTDLGTFDLVISSPPYCTRIDYAVATTPELLALGSVDSREFSALRRRIIGSVVTGGSAPSATDSRSTLLHATLEAIRQHHTKAASTYYARYFTRYFDDLARSLHQLACTVRKGHIVLVVQNSYFKDIELNLRSIVTELMQNEGLALSEAHEHSTRPSIADSNPRFKIYRNSNIRTENVLVFSAQ